jgi:hypothetical protein
VAAKYILAVLAVVFITAAMFRLRRGGGRLHAQGRTWLLVGFLFALISSWLFIRG